MSATPEFSKLPYRRWFPWLHLFRAGSLALGWPQLGISLVAVIVFWIGTAGLSWYVHDSQLDDSFPPLVEVVIEETNLETFHAVELQEPISPAFRALLLPWRSLTHPVEHLVWKRTLADRQDTASGSFWANACYLCWAMIVWSLFGTAICRAVSVEIATDRSESLPQVFRFAWAHWTGAMSAPLIPAAGILIMTIGLFVVSLLGRVPGVGSAGLTLISPGLLLVGVAIAFLTFVILFGWPLMVAAMGIEDCDGFGALSRSYSFLAGRPAHAIWNAAVSGIFGGLFLTVTCGLLAFGLISLSHCMESAIGTPQRWWTILGWSHRFAQAILASVAVSLFWSLTTLNYLLLRQAVDGKPFEDIAHGVGDHSMNSDLPVVGIAASNLPAEERDRLISNSEAEAVMPAS